MSEEHATLGGGGGGEPALYLDAIRLVVSPLFLCSDNTHITGSVSVGHLVEIYHI